MTTERDEMTEALCAQILTALPKAQQSTKWNAPNFSIDGQDVVTLNFPPKGGVRIVFHRGAKAVDTKTGTRLVADDSGRLKWATDQRAYAAFATLDDVNMAQEWLADFAPKWVAAAKSI